MLDFTIVHLYRHFYNIRTFYKGNKETYKSDMRLKENIQNLPQFTIKSTL